jgi:glutathione S-transferase
MKLIGLYDSPFVRRVAISLHVQGFNFQHVPLSVFRNMDAFRLYNPLIKAPTLVLSDGTILTESSFILDYLDEQVPDKRLVPANGAARLAALQQLAIALVATEKTVALVYETALRPEEKHFAPLQERFRAQVTSALELLEARIGPLALGEHLNQVTITTAVAYRFIGHMVPDLLGHGRYPHLAALSTQCEELPSFLSAPLES